MSKVNFTKATLAALQPNGSRFYVSDAKCQALTLAVHPSGQKTFFLYRRVSGRPQRIKIGGFPELTVEQARKQAMKLNGDIAQGKNPQAERRAVAQAGTFAAAFETYMEHAESRCKPKSLKEDRRIFDVYLKPLHTRRLTDIQPTDVQALHTKTKKDHGPYMANRVFEVIRKVLRFSRLFHVCDGISKFQENKRERYLDGTELHRLFETLKADADTDLRDFVLVALFTGARRGNVLGMKWADVDLESGVWRVAGEESKNGQPLVIVLAPPAVAILQARARVHADVFRDAKGFLVQWKKGWERVREAAAIPDVRVHDLRRTLGSWQAAAGASLTVIGKSLGHQSTQATSIYARIGLDPVRQSVNAVATAMMAHAPAKGLLPEPTKTTEGNGRAD